MVHRISFAGAGPWPEPNAPECPDAERGEERAARPLVSEAEAVGRPALPEVVQEYLEFVWRLLRRLGLSSARADDVTQEVFLVFVRRLAEVEVGRERSFLYGVVVRLASNEKRQERRRREVFGVPLDDMRAHESLPDERVEQRRRVERLDQLLQELPPKLRRVLVLSDLLDQDLMEVAELECIPVGTVSSRLRRARMLFERKVRRLAGPPRQAGTHE